jgi:hypothetical protein
MFVIVRDAVRHANLNETINYKISLHLSIQGCLALACLGEFHLLFLYPASFENVRSAGGQLLHPSEVKSSTSATRFSPL